MKQFFAKNWFLVCLLLALLGGSLFHGSLKWAEGNEIVRWSIVAITMFSMAWPLRFDSIVHAFKNPLAPLYACVINLGILPLIAWPLSFLLDKDLGIGLLVAAATPCTLASAAVWTRKAGGNDVVALMVSVATNATCFLTLPFWLWVTLGSGEELSSGESTVSFGSIAMKLLLVVFVPIVLAQCSRMVRPIAVWATGHKTQLGIVAQAGILSIVFMGSIKTGQRMSESDIGGQLGQFMLGTLLVVGIHCATFVLGFYSSKAVGLKRGDRIAVAFAGSQKTLMIGLTTSLALGVSILPIVAYHAMQLIIDTFIANYMAKESARLAGPDS